MKAVWVLLCFGGYLRPSDALRLRRQDFVAPVPGVSGKFWCLVLNTSEFEETSKTGISDESMIWDNFEAPCMGPIFQAIEKAGPPTELVFEFSYPEMVSSFRAATGHWVFRSSSRTSSGTRVRVGTSCTNGAANLQ